MDPVQFWNSIGLRIKIKRKRGKRGGKQHISKNSPQLSGNPLLTSNSSEKLQTNSYNRRKFFYMNACSLNPEKLDQFEVISNSVDVIAISETELQ